MHEWPARRWSPTHCDVWLEVRLYWNRSEVVRSLSRTATNRVLRQSSGDTRCDALHVSHDNHALSSNRVKQLLYRLPGQTVGACMALMVDSLWYHCFEPLEVHMRVAF